MDQSDAKDLAQLNQLLTHVDATSIANHALLNSIFFWGVIGAIAITAIYLRHKTRIEHTRLLQILAEKGQPIPPELLKTGSGSPANPIARAIAIIGIGIVLIGAGLATSLFLWAMTSGYFGPGDPNTWLPFAGAFPLFVGFAFLAIGLYQRRHG